MGKKASNHAHNNSLSIVQNDSIRLLGINSKKDLSLVYKKDD